MTKQFPPLPQIGLSLLALSLPTGCTISRPPSPHSFRSLVTPPADLIPTNTSVLTTIRESSSASSFAHAHGIAVWQNHIAQKNRIVAFTTSDFKAWKQDIVQELTQRGVSKVLVDLDGNVIDPEDPSSIHIPVSPFFEDRDT